MAELNAQGPFACNEEKTNLRVGLLLYGGVKRGVSQKAKFLGLAQKLVDDVARVHAGARGKADGRARVVVIRHAVRAALVDTCAAFLFQA